MIEDGILRQHITGKIRIDGKELRIIIIKIEVTAPLFSLGVSAGDTEAVQKKTRKNAML